MTHQCQEILRRRLCAIALFQHLGDGGQDGQHFLMQIRRWLESIQKSTENPKMTALRLAPAPPLFTLAAASAAPLHLLAERNIGAGTVARCERLIRFECAELRFGRTAVLFEIERFQAHGDVVDGGIGDGLAIVGSVLLSRIVFVDRFQG